MKRFFAIFGICFGSLVVFLGGYLGVKWLIGDFNPKLIPPEKIEFQQSEYYFDEGQESYNLLITTSTEGVTETKVTLQFSTNGKQAADKNFWTDGVIVIPKVVTLNKPFEVTLVKDNTYASEVDDAALNNWIRGGISNIIATSEHNLTPPATTTIYVDTPVYKTELVVLNNEQNEFNFTNAFKNVEHSNFSTILNNNVSNIRAGETFYVALKYYPSASAFKYNKISSTNALVQYKNDILAKLAELGLNSESYFSELNQLCENEQPKNIDDVLTLYKQLISSENESLNSYIENLLVNFNKNLKYNALLEKTNIENKVNIVGKVNGTNLYEVVATQNLGRAEFYSYSFYKSSVENQELNNFGAVDYDVLEAAFENGTAIRNTNAVNVVDVEVDTITLSGSIDSIRAGDVFTIYANKSGTNNIKTAYLNIDLSNSTLSDIDLKDKVVNVGIRFEKKLGVDWVDASSDITLKNIENYQAIKIYDDNGNLKETYYRPYGSAHYWEVYANNYAEGEFRAVIKYFIEYYTTIKETIKNPQTGEDEIVDKIITCYEEILIDEKNYSYPTFSLRETSSETENMISWVNTQEVKQEIVEIYGSVSLSNPVTVIPEYDLSNLVNRESLNQNVYTTTRYFIYSNEGDEVLSDYFNTVNSEAITYTFANGSFKLYELPTSVLKLKSSQAVPEYAVMAVFMTVKTDINGAPIYEDQQIGKYEYVKYSAVKDNMLERLSPIKFTFEKSLSTLTGKIEIVDNYVADYVNIYNGDDLRQEFWLAKDTPNILIVQIESPEGEEDKFQRAIQDGKISVVAKSNIGDVNNYVNYVIDETRDGISTFYISTKRVENDSQVSIFIVYSIDGVDYYFQVNYTTDVLVSIEPITFEEKTFEYFIIKSNTSSKAAFNIKHLHKDDIINYVTSSKNIKNITIQRIYSEVDGLYDSYTINFVDGYNCGHTSENIIFDKNCVFNSDGTIRAEITNFLMNNDKTTKWHLTSSNTAVAKITEDKIVTFVGSGEVEISLFVDGINEAQDVIKFIFIDNGYVSEYAYTTLGQNTIVTGFNNTDNVYTSRALPLSQLGYAGSKIILRDSNTNINNNTALLSMWYYIEDGDQVENNNNKKLNFKVVLDENSIDVYKQLFDANYSEGDNLPNELTLKNNLGAPTTLNLIYVHEQIDITIRVSLTISAVINIEKFIVKNSSGNSVAPVDSYADEFNVYAGHNYALDVELGGEFKDSQELVYLLKDKNGNFKPVSTSTSGIRLVNKDNGMYCFDDVSEETEVVIYVSTTQTPQIGDLQKAITFNVSPNVEISNYVAENNYEIHIELLDNGKASYDLLDATKGLFARKVSNSNNLDASLFSLEAIECCTYVNDSQNDDYGKIIFDFTDSFYGIANSTSRTLTFTYANKALNGIRFVITPKDYVKDNATRIAVYNGQKAIVLVHDEPYQDLNYNFKIDIIENQFDAENIHVVGNISEYLSNNKIAIASSTLFTDSGATVMVSDNSGNYKTYKIILSTVQYPFINVSSNKGVKNEDLDIYKMFVLYGAEDLVSYYEQNGLYVGPENLYGLNSANLLAETVADSTSIYTILNSKSGSLSFDYKLPNGNSASSFIEIDITQEDELITKIVGSNLNVYFVLKYKIGGYTYSIPTIINIKQSQRVLVNYEFDDRVIDNYGEEEYDNLYMLKSENFANGLMEYVQLNGTTNVEISNERFTVEQYNDGTWVKVDYTDGYSYKIVKLYTYNAGVWTEVTSSINSYATVSDNMVTFYQRGVSAIRVKIEVTTKSGAICYYYIEANSSSTLTLYKKVGTTEVSIGSGKDVIFVETGATIEFANPNATSDFNYYLKNNNDKLFYKVNGVKQGTNKYTIETYPNGANLVIEAYTLYGTVCVINVNVAPYYSVSAKEDLIIYSGTDRNVGDLVEIKTTGANPTNVAGFTLLNSSDGITLDGYGIANGKIRFNHNVNDYVISNLTFYVQIESYTYLVSIPNVQVKANIIPNYTTKAKDFGEQIENSGKITIGAADWQSLFIVNQEPYIGVKYYVNYNDKEVELTSGSDCVIEIGQLTQSTKLNLSFKLLVTISELPLETLTFESKAEIIAKPEYTAVINYSQGDESSFNREYVQLGSEIDFSANTINGKARIKLIKTATIGTESEAEAVYTLTLKNSKGEELSLTDSKYKFENQEVNGVNVYAKGDYTVEIKYNNSVYGIYYLTVQESAPIAVDYSNIEDQVFYAGFGHKEILNYVDSIVTVPAIDSSVTTYSVVAKIDEETDVVLQETVYNNFSSSVIRIAISLEEYAKGVTTQNIFAKYQINSEDVYEACSITFAPRYSIIYNGYPVNIAYYGNILDTAEEASIDDETKDQNVVTYNLNIKLNCDIVAEAEIETLYYVTCDINVNTNNEEINYTLNANEYEDGLSLVDMFNINDNLGNKFWINHIAENKVISLTYDSHIDAVTGKNINNAKANSILLEPTEIDFDGTKLSYDYSLIAMGATNNGTVVALTFKYIVDEITYAKTIKIKVISDIEYSLLNNDGNNTPNSESNPLILKNIKSYTIADASQTSMDSSKYYIYAYGKYDKSKKNVAQTLIVSQDGYGNFGACSKSGDNLIFTYGTRATFGDKHVVLTLTDNYGFSFKYYITLVSTNRITGVQLTQEAYFEDSDLVVFNRNKTPITVNTGISVNLEDAEGMTDSTTVIQIESINIYVTIDGKETPLQNSNIENAYYINYSVNNAGSVIKFNYQNQDFWMLGDNNKAVTLKLRIAIVGKTDEDSQPGEETYTLTSTIVLCKRYEMSVKEENTYVRDDVPFELEHLVSVYDYSISSYLGEASIEKAEAIKLNFALNENYTESKTIEVVEYTDEYQKSHNAKLILDKLNIYKLMIARAKTDNGKYDVEGLGEFEIKYTVDDQEKTVNTFDDKTAEIILNALNINYVNDEKPYYTQTIKIIAINKESGKETESKYATVKYVYDNGIMKCAEDNFIYLGIHQTAFGTTELNIENFNYEVYYDDVLIAQTAEVIKETGVTNVTTALLTNITTEKTIAGKDGEEDKKVNYYHPIATLAEVSVLNVASYSGKLLSGDVSVDCFVLIDSGEEQLSPIYLNKGSNVIYLENYANSKVELYTGYVTVTGSESFVYTKSTVEDENKLVCYNGFLKEQVMLAKNIHKVTLFDSDGNQITEFDDEGNSKASKQSLSVEKSFSIDNDGVLYQDISSKVQIEFLSNTYTESDYYTYTNVEDIRVTLKYTSIDTSNAYVGTTGIHLVEIAEDKFGVLANDLTINLMDTETEAEGEETKVIAGWAQDFKLVPGVGRTKELSMQTEKDQLSFASAIERKYIKFALKAVTSSSGGELTAGSLVSLNETNGDLTLLKNFDTTLYYVTIDVSCKYPTADGASETSWQSIGTVRLGFQTTQQ